MALERLTPRARRAVGGLVVVTFGAFLTALALFASRPLATVKLARFAVIEWNGGDFVGARGVVLQRSFYDCGPAALANLLALMGGPALSLDSLARLTETTPRGTSLGALARAAARLGHQLEVRRFTPPIPLNDVLPMIAWVGGSHFVAVAGRSDRGVLTILDPQLGAYRMPEAAFAREWHGEALVPRPLISASGGAP